MSRLPRLDTHYLVMPDRTDAHDEHQALTEREAMLAADIADEEQREHERAIRERDADTTYQPGSYT